MSHDAQPINPELFARALEDLPVDSLHAKAAEIRNSIAHLKSSNEQMLPFAEEGDQDCKEAMFENLIVITRMNERIQLLRNEVEKRGMRWADAEVEERDAVSDPTNTNGELANGTAAHGSEAPGVSAGTAHAPESRAPSGRLTDEELVRRLQEQMGEDEEEGVHL